MSDFEKMIQAKPEIAVETIANQLAEIEQQAEIIKDYEAKGYSLTYQQQAEQITALEEAIAENEITTADQQGILDEQAEQIQRLKELQDDTQDHCDTLQDMLLIKEQENKNLIDERNHLAGSLVQANLDIITLERRNDTMDKDYDLLVEVITEQDAEITRLKSNQSKFSG